MAISSTQQSSNEPQLKTAYPGSNTPPDDWRLKEERTAARIRELTSQRNEIFRQVTAQLKADPPLSHKSIILAMEEFYNFFTGYTDYFWSLPSDQLTGHGRTHESVLNRALDNTRQLWQQLSLAVNQRYNPVYGERLAAADEKAAGILDQTQAIVRGMPILYFDKIFQISRHPYQTYPLLGISQDRFEFDGDASLAHELGHHVFWNNGELAEYAARLDFIHEQIARTIFANGFPPVDFANPAAAQRVIRSNFSQYTIWVGWIEELFADVFGALIIGPRFAKSAQDVLVREHLGRPIDLLASDGEHPIPALRPYIATSTLKAIAALRDDKFGADLAALAAQLEARWHPIWSEALEEEKRGLPKESVGAHLGHGDTNEQPSASLKELREQIVPMVALVLTQVKFVSNADAQRQTQSLLEAIKYWGMERTAGDAESIRSLLEELLYDPILPVESRMRAESAGYEFEQLSVGESLFDRFMAFVEDRRRTVIIVSPVSPELPEMWEEVLEFDLALGHGYHSYCSDHDGSGCHKHVGTYQTRVGCS